MQNYINYYQLLDIEPTATNDVIMKSFKEKAKEYHPDKNAGHPTATKLFQYIQEAKEVLTDPQKRLEYDYIAGIKRRPGTVSENKNFGPLLAAGVVGLLVGVFIGSLGSD